MDDQNNKPKPSLNAYRRTDVMTANRETILLMMYSGGIRFLKRAIEAAEKGDLAEKGKYIGKTQGIVSELRATLNLEIGGDIAKNLEQLYAYITQRLLQGSTASDTAALKEVLDILTTLNEAWEGAIASLKKERLSTEK